jgi:DNA topoisomerase-1
MSKPLVIVESPAKAKTIAKFLGDGFDVRASVGHIADLPSKGLSVDVDNGFKPTYELTERGSTIIKELKSVLKTASALYLATDEDREGEAIAAHLFEYLKPKNIETNAWCFMKSPKLLLMQQLQIHETSITNLLTQQKRVVFSIAYTAIRCRQYCGAK